MIVSRAARAAFLVAIAAQMGCVGRDTRPQQHGTIAGAGDERIGPSAESDPIVTTRTREQVSAVAPVPAAHRTRRADEPEGAEVLDARALAYLAQGRLELAEDAANRALAVTARFAPAHNTLGLVHVRRGELDLARAEFARARQIDPALFAAFMNEGALALDARLYAEALGLFTRAVEIRPTDYDAWISVGVARRGMGDPAGGARRVRARPVHGPDSPRGLFRSGRASRARLRRHRADLRGRSNDVRALPPARRNETRVCRRGREARRALPCGTSTSVGPRRALSARQTARDGVDRPDAGGCADAGRDGAHPGAGRRARGALRRTR